MRAGWPWRLLAVRSAVAISDAHVLVEGRHPDSYPLHRVRSARVRKGWSGTRLDLDLFGAGAVSIFGLPHAPAERLAVELNRLAAQHRAQTAAAAVPVVRQAAADVAALFDGSRWVRHSESRALAGRLDRVAELSETARHCFDQTTAQAAAELVALRPHLEAHRTATNRRYIERERAATPAVISALLPGERELSDEQTRAVVSGEDCTLVLAGAGSGKTTTIVGKVAHLVGRCGVPAEQVLVLAYNRRAADELAERLKPFPGITVRTFHGFGRDVIRSAEQRAPMLAPFAEDSAALGKLLSDCVERLAQHPATAGLLLDYFVSYLAPARSAFDFGTLGEYYEYVRAFELRTLDGVLVKSFEELAIANFLTANGVRFEYERPYRHDTHTAEYRQYQPDFYLPDHDLYIEHFGVDRDGRTAPGIDAEAYARKMDWARGVHRDRGTTLVETYTYQRQEGVLLSELERRLRACGVTLTPVPADRFLEQLRAQGAIGRLAGLLGTFLSHFRSNGESMDVLEARAEALPDRARLRAFLAVFRAVLAEYEQVLRDAGQVDFDELIRQAVGHITGGRYDAPYSQVLVDEFQDISAGRAALLRALVGRTGAALYAVGDDWQSIYRFAGSDVAILRHCDRHFGHTERRDLTQTFRFSDRLLGVASRFVLANPDQITREVRAHRRADAVGVHVVAARHPREGVAAALAAIGAVAPPHASVLVLGRYRNSRAVVPDGRSHGSLRVSFSTVHAAKGREADYVIVLDLKDDRWGFPSLVEDDPILDLVLPEPESFPHAEERRLFYVALTRARHQAYLVADPAHPSAFVDELQADGYEVGWHGDEFWRSPTCPRCVTGRLQRSGRRFHCANRPYCAFKAPLCVECGRGAMVPARDAAHCSTDGCRNTDRLCPRCRQGYLETKTGRFGPFLGCSEYRASPPCPYTERVAPASNG